ncbi:MAG: hypothetical protein CL908_18640 [Deltaproteobacteria bacterium]|nr:hypothetical protein [Deltaproteobacteria bacterium]
MTEPGQPEPFPISARVEPLLDDHAKLEPTSRRPALSPRITHHASRITRSSMTAAAALAGTCLCNPPITCVAASQIHVATSVRLCCQGLETGDLDL